MVGTATVLPFCLFHAATSSRRALPHRQDRLACCLDGRVGEESVMGQASTAIVWHSEEVSTSNLST